MHLHGVCFEFAGMVRAFQTISSRVEDCYAEMWFFGFCFDHPCAYMTEFSSAALGMHPTFIRSYLRRTTTVPHDSREPMAGFATEGG